MEQNQLDKIKLAFSYMDDTYWKKATDRSADLSVQMAKVTAVIKDSVNKLLMLQLNILNAKYKGYERLISSKESKLAEIIRENKECIGELTEEKNQTATALLASITELNAMIEEIRTLGEQ